MDPNAPGLSALMTLGDAVVGRLIDFIPKAWKAAELRVRFRGSNSAEMQVVNPDTSEGWTVSHELMEAVLKLDEHRRESQLPWPGIVFSVRQNTSDGWEVSVDVA